MHTDVPDVMAAADSFRLRADQEGGIVRELSEQSRRRVVRFIGESTWEGLPEAVRTKLKACLLDCLGATLAGTCTKVAAIADQYAAETWQGSGSTVLRSSRDTAVVAAAFANAVAANGTDIDDCGVFTGGHPGAQVFPVSLALTEAAGGGGRDLLRAMLVGYEVAFRAGRCMNHRHAPAEERDFRACGSWGSVADAAIAAHVMRLTEEQTAEALGIAEYHAPELPMMRDIDDPAMVKHGMGIGAMTGVMSARLAALGFTGVPSILFFDEYADWVRDLGTDYLLLTGMMWKRFSSCAWGHPALYAVRKAVDGVSFEPASVRRVVVTAYREACRLGVRLPRTEEEAQFNVAWPVACLLVHGEVAPEHMLEPALADPLKRALAGRVELCESAEFTRLYDLAEALDPAGREMAEVTIELADGRRLESGPVQGEVYGDWPWPEVEAKFRRATRGVLDEACVASLVEQVRHIEDAEDLTSFVRTAASGLTKAAAGREVVSPTRGK